MGDTPDNFIGVDPAQLARLIDGIEDMPETVLDAAIDELAPYLVNVFQQYPPEKRVTRKEAYGQTFFSDRQRRWFFAALRSGELQLPYERTQTLRRGWKVIGEGRNSLVVNETPYAGYVMGDEGQSRMMAKIGWLRLSEILSDRADRIREKLEAGIRKGLQRLKIGDDYDRE